MITLSVIISILGIRGYYRANYKGIYTPLDLFWLCMWALVCLGWVIYLSFKYLP